MKTIINNSLRIINLSAYVQGRLTTVQLVPDALSNINDSFLKEIKNHDMFNKYIEGGTLELNPKVDGKAVDAKETKAVRQPKKNKSKASPQNGLGDLKDL